MSSLSPSRVKCTIIALGIGDSMKNERIVAMPGVEQIMMILGVIVEMDAQFQVGVIVLLLLTLTSIKSSFF